MDLELIVEGAQFTLYGIRAGESLWEFLERLCQDNPAEYARIDRRLTQMAERGPSRHNNEFNDLGNGLFEMKTRGGVRVVFFYDAGHLVICTHGFVKKSKKTPRKELELARMRKAAYEQVREQNGPFRIIVTDDQKEPERKP
ncbi:MAG: hypothetical protein C0404_00815 [Verrucomicrobia bacterium]|nr:hypothetical protein [Verrucomicrobiota bacterium]